MVDNMYGQYLFASGSDQRRDVKFKRSLTAFVSAGKLTVNINLSYIIHTSKVQNYSFALPSGRNGYFAGIEHRRNKIGVTDTGKSTFRTERHQYFAVKQTMLCQFTRSSSPPLGKYARRIKIFGIPAAFPEIKFKTPFAIKVQPAVTDKLRTGMFRTRHRKITHYFYSTKNIEKLTFNI